MEFLHLIWRRGWQDRSAWTHSLTAALGKSADRCHRIFHRFLIEVRKQKCYLSEGDRLHLICVRNYPTTHSVGLLNGNKDLNFRNCVLWWSKNCVKDTVLGSIDRMKPKKGYSQVKGLMTVLLCQLNSFLSLCTVEFYLKLNTFTLIYVLHRSNWKGIKREDS